MQFKQPTKIKILSTDSGVQLFSPKWHWKQPWSLKHCAVQAEIFLKDGKGKMTVAKKIKGSGKEINLIPVPGNTQNACPVSREQPPTGRAPLG